MNVYITIGTLDFLKNIQKRYPSETMIMMTNEDGALLLHETASASVFTSPREYEVFQTHGNLEKGRITVMDHIPVSDVGRPLFEQKCESLFNTLKNQTGLTAIRFLRSLTTNTYVILTAWDSVIAFQAWKKSDSYALSGNDWELNPEAHIFETAPYENIYTVI